MAKGDIKYVVTADTKKGKAAIKEFDQKVDKLGKTSKTAAGGFKSLAAKVAVGVAAFYAASKALKGVIRWMGDAVDKAAIQQTAEAEMRAALESTGREVESNAEHFKKYASEIQGATIFGDEQILSAQALMIQLTKLDQKGLDAATKGAIGLASVYKTDLQAATTLVGKALAGNYGALSRYGLSVERTATAEEKRAQLLSQLLTMYKRAEAEVDTHAGAMGQLSNIYGDLKEQVGKTVTESEDFRDSLKLLTELTKELIDSGLVEWMTDVAIQAVKATPFMQSVATQLAIIAVLLKIRAENEKLASETTKEWIKHLQLNDDLQKKLREDIAAVIEVTEEQEEAVKDTTEAWTALNNRWAGMELEAEIERLRNLVDATLSVKEEADELAYAWDQDMVGMEESTLNFMASIIPGMAFMTESIGENFEAMGEGAKLGLESAAAEAGAILSSLGQHSKALAYAGAIINTAMAVTQALRAYPPPISFVMAALQSAAGAVQIAAISSQAIPSGLEGGLTTREGIYHLHAGELVTPASRVSNIYNQTTHGGARAVFNINITTTRAVNAEQLFRDMKREAHRYGYNL